ncbi:MAG: DUF736 family protein [Proteobacteria bacterium]|nr:DUF736 family protein [Pseudomonadota bacterium]
MAIIGMFTPSREGGWIGRIRTLTVNSKIRLVPNDNRHGDHSPNYRIYVGASEIGAAWHGRPTNGRPGRYLHVLLDDPSLSEPLSAAMIEAPDGLSARLLWGRRRP